MISNNNIDVECFYKFIEINNSSFDIPKKYLLRGGDGIAGSSLEEVFSLPENNYSVSDFSTFELKTKKDSSNAKTTLFNKGSRKSHWSIPVDYFKKEYGTGYIDFSVTPNKYNIKISVDDNNILIVNNESLFTYYKINFNEIEEVLLNKLKNLMMVEISINDGKMVINKTTYYEMASINNFIDLINDGLLYICSNVGSNNHDRGTQFRISKNNLHKLYKNKTEKIWI